MYVVFEIILLNRNPSFEFIYSNPRFKLTRFHYHSNLINFTPTNVPIYVTATDILTITYKLVV